MNRIGGLTEGFGRAKPIPDGLSMKTNQERSTWPGKHTLHRDHKSRKSICDTVYS